VSSRVFEGRKSFTIERREEAEWLSHCDTGASIHRGVVTSRIRFEIGGVRLGRDRCCGSKV
jgi:hypothetical protein